MLFNRRLRLFNRVMRMALDSNFLGLLYLREEGVRFADLDSHGENLLVAGATIFPDSAIRFFVDHGVDINAPDGEGRTPLHKAVSMGDARLASLLLTLGANPNAADVNHATPLHIAATWSFSDCVVALIECGADVTVADIDGLTPRQHASPAISDLIDSLVERRALLGVDRSRRVRPDSSAPSV